MDQEMAFRKSPKKLVLKESYNGSCGVTDRDVLLTELVLYSCHNGERVLLELADGSSAVLVPEEDLRLLEDLES